jgi:hypothetical protein
MAPVEASGDADVEAVDEQWQAVVAAVRGTRGVTVVAPAADGARRFGSTSLRVNGKIFAMIAAKGRFVVKLPAARVDELVRTGDGEHFDRHGKRWMKEWVAMTPGTERQWAGLAGEALTFVASAAA